MLAMFFANRQPEVIPIFAPVGTGYEWHANKLPFSLIVRYCSQIKAVAKYNQCRQTPLPYIALLILSVIQKTLDYIAVKR